MKRLLRVAERDGVDWEEKPEPEPDREWNERPFGDDPLDRF
jgi:hypothetical protein